MDNKKVLAYLISDEGKRNLVNVIVGGIEAYACYCSSWVEKMIIIANFQVCFLCK